MEGRKTNTQKIVVDDTTDNAVNKHYCYILRCSDGTLYTGYATDPIRRLQEHNESDKGAKYTRTRRPCTLVYTEAFETRSEAMKREYYIKHKMTRLEKEALISENANAYGNSFGDSDDSNK